MAQKKGLIYRLTMGKDNLPDFTPNKLPGSRWAVFKDVFTNRLGAMAKVSLLSVLFAIPAIAWIVIMSLVKAADGTIIPYSSNLGIGYPVITNAAAIGAYRTFMYNVYTYVMLIPGLMIFGVGLAGAFHVLKLLAWGEGVSVASTFFNGIKKNWSRFLFIFFFFGLSLFMFMFNIRAYSVLDAMPAWLRTVSLVLSVMQFVMVTCMTMYMCTQEVTYKLGLGALIKNSFLLTIALIPQNLFFLILSAIPIVILLILPLQFAIFGWLIFALLGPAYMVLIYTVFSQWVFDKFVNDKVKGAVKNRGMYVPDAETDKATEIERIRTRNTQYGAAYVSRRLSSIDKGKSFTPLATTFSRDDLAKMNEEKEIMREEIEKERTDVENQLNEEYERIEQEKKAAEKPNRRARRAEEKAKRAAQAEEKESAIATMPVSEEEYREDDDK